MGVFLYVLGAMYRKCLLGWIGSQRDAMRATEKQGVRERSIICKDPPEDEPWKGCATVWGVTRQT